MFNALIVDIMELEFGKKVSVGNYYILKHSKSLMKNEVKRLRTANNIPADVQKHLERASLPYIKVATVTDSWSIDFVIGTSMYDALDGVKVVMDGEGNRQLYGVEAKNVEATIVAMFADTTTVGDYEYQVEKQKLLGAYLDRASKAKNEAADAGKGEEELAKESEDAVQEVIDRDRHAETILEMGEQVRKEESEVSHGEQH